MLMVDHDKIQNNCLVLYSVDLNETIIHINIDEYKLSIKKIDEIINKFNIKQVDNYKIFICKRYINLKKNELKEIIKLIDIEKSIEQLIGNKLEQLNSITKQINNFKNDLTKIKSDLSIFLCINSDQFSLIISTLNLDMNQTFYTKEIISSMTLKKEVREIKLKQNENKQFDLIDEYFNLLLKLIIKIYS